MSELLHAPLPVLRSALLGPCTKPAIACMAGGPHSAPAALGSAAEHGPGSSGTPPTSGAASACGAGAAGAEARSSSGFCPGFSGGQHASRAADACSAGAAGVELCSSAGSRGAGATFVGRAVAARGAAGAAKHLELHPLTQQGPDTLAEHLERLLLEAVASGCTSSAQDVQALLKCTLARHQVCCLLLAIMHVMIAIVTPWL